MCGAEVIARICANYPNVLSIARAECPGFAFIRTLVVSLISWHPASLPLVWIYHWTDRRISIIIPCFLPVSSTMFLLILTSYTSNMITDQRSCITNGFWVCISHNFSCYCFTLMRLYLDVELFIAGTSWDVYSDLCETWSREELHTYRRTHRHTHRHTSYTNQQSAYYYISHRIKTSCYNLTELSCARAFSLLHYSFIPLHSSDKFPKCIQLTHSPASSIGSVISPHCLGLKTIRMLPECIEAMLKFQQIKARECECAQQLAQLKQLCWIPGKLARFHTSHHKLSLEYHFQPSRNVP